MMRRLALLAAVVVLATTPAMAAKLTSATFGIAGVARVSCGVTYRGTAETVVGIQIFNLATSLLDKEAHPVGWLPHWWRIAGCPEAGCGAPWCQVTTDLPKTQFRATMCVESRTPARPTRWCSPPSSACRWNSTVLD